MASGRKGSPEISLCICGTPFAGFYLSTYEETAWKVEDGANEYYSVLEESDQEVIESVTDEEIIDRTRSGRSICQE